MEKINCPICNNGNHSFLFETVDIKSSKKRFKIVKCDNCGLLLTNPRPSFTEINELYPSDYYSYLPPKIKTRKKNSNLLNKRFLDIGFGSGSLMIKKENEGFESFGVEISEKSIKNSKELGLNISLYDGKQLPFDDKFFDIVNMGQVIEHVHYINDLLNEIKRVLKPDGLLMIGVPNIESYDAKIYGKYWRHLDVPSHLYHFSPLTLEKLLVNKSFKIDKISTCNTPALTLTYLASSYTTIKIYIGLNSSTFIRKYYGAVFVMINFIRYFLHRKITNDGQMLNVIAKIDLSAE